VKAKPLPSIEYLRECFDLDAETGILIWRRRPDAHFALPASAAQWNGHYAGRPAGCLNSEGYLIFRVNGRNFFAHRIVYALANGVAPGEMQVDHINRVKADNRPANLRLATHSQNRANLGGPRGIIWDPTRRKWTANVCRDGRVKFLGRFADKAEAQRVADAARREKYGEFFA